MMIDVAVLIKDGINKDMISQSLDYDRAVRSDTALQQPRARSKALQGLFMYKLIEDKCVDN